uniref:Uncharacterized protein n=1 Tax=Hucho hucho TaxID=62062 RepID=A0A4W5JWM6_9TELE
PLTSLSLSLSLSLSQVICQKASKSSSQYEACKKALQSVSKVVRKCNEGARTMERTEMMYTINSQLDFKIKVRRWAWNDPQWGL